MGFLISYAYAQTATSDSLGKVLTPVIDHIISPVVKLVFVVGVFVFAFGVIQMIISGDNPEARKKGQLHILWGSVGMFIMLSAWGIIHLISNTVSGFN